jgi:deoxyribonuclease V
MPFEHEWNVTPSKAVSIQKSLAQHVVASDDLGSLGRIAGVDVGIDRRTGMSRAAVAVLAWPDLRLVESVSAQSPTGFPYVPGLLSFREVPVILEALYALEAPPDVVLCDGQGLAHPRRFGLACHLGVVSGLPTVGVAKSRLIGTHESVPVEKGAWVHLIDRDEVVGAVVRTRSRVRPLYVSVGHRVSLERAVELTLSACTRFRLPETTRAAHRIASGSRLE